MAIYNDLNLWYSHLRWILWIQEVPQLQCVMYAKSTLKLRKPLSSCSWWRESQLTELADLSSLLRFCTQLKGLAGCTLTPQSMVCELSLVTTISHIKLQEKVNGATRVKGSRKISGVHIQRGNINKFTQRDECCDDAQVNMWEFKSLNLHNITCKLAS